MAGRREASHVPNGRCGTVWGWMVEQCLLSSCLRSRIMASLKPLPSSRGSSVRRIVSKGQLPLFRTPRPVANLNPGDHRAENGSSNSSSGHASVKWEKAGCLFGAAVAGFVLRVSPAAAEGEPVPTSGSDIDGAIEALVGAVKSTGDFVKSSIATVDSGIKILKQGYDAAAPVVEQGVKAISPVVEQAIDAATPTIKAALPALQGAEKALESSIQSDTLDSVVAGAGQALSVATPIASKTISFLSAVDPVTLGEYALGSIAFVYLAPSLLGALAGLTRGFAGEITAAQVLDALSDGSSVLIDVRTPKEKDSSGVPDVPSSVSSKVIDVDFASIEDKKLRGSLRDPSGLEATVTALQIASLKRVGGGTKIILLDRYGPVARAVAKELARKGFGKVFTVQGGFDGRDGWLQSKLQIKPSAAVLSAPASAPKSFGFGTRKALQAPKV